MSKKQKVIFVNPYTGQTASTVAGVKRWKSPFHDCDNVKWKPEGAEYQKRKGGPIRKVMIAVKVNPEPWEKIAG
jgi:hypothetical protein